MKSLIIDDDKLSRTLIEKFVQRTDYLKEYTSFENAIDAINYLKRDDVSIDLIFLDIEMPEMNGVEFMRLLGKRDIQIIVVSAKEKYAIDAIEFDVTDYLLKPVTYARFMKSVEKAYDKFFEPISIPDGDNSGSDFFIRNNASLIRLSFNDVIWVEAMENYIVVNTYDEKYTIHFTMKAVTERLPSDMFFRIHRSYIVNRKQINIIKTNTVEVNTGEGIKALPIGKSYRDQLLNDINLFSK